MVLQQERSNTTFGRFFVMCIQEHRATCGHLFEFDCGNDMFRS